MLDCKACIRRCLRTIFGDGFQIPQYRQQTHAFQLQQRWHQLPPRMHSTAAAAVQSQEPLSTVPVRPFRSTGVNQYGDQRVNAIRRGQQFKTKHLERELPYLTDPLKLANHILGLLRRDEPKKALEIVRLASSKQVPCTVSWNHLVDYEMSKGWVTGAMKIYNEMKKRAQPPDSHTYTIILRGLAVYKDHPHSLIRALSVYNSMFAPNSPVKPSITHSNAVLKVCARRLDMDALYGIAAKLPTHGAGAADNRTFTTILNAVRHAAWTFDGFRNIGETPEETAERRQRAVMEGRRMWDDIIRRWRKGDIWIDEELVCAMGRLLLISRHPQDLDDVLSLVEQTMAIPRAIPRLNAPERSFVAPVPARLFHNSPKRLPTENEPGMDKRASEEEEEEEQEQEQEEEQQEEEQQEEEENKKVEEERLTEEAEAEESEGTEEREDSVRLRQTDQPHQISQLDEASESFGANSAVQKPSSSPVLSDSEFTPVDISHTRVFNPRTRTTQPLAYVWPGNNTLSLLMDACMGMRATTAAQDYWGLLTGEVSAGGRGIVPDAENYFMYLRLLRLNRASRLAVDLVEEHLGSADQHVDRSGMLALGPMASKHGYDLAVPKTFRIAMSACVRDKANPNALHSAARLLRLMQARLQEPDVKTLGMYLDVAAAAGVRSEVRRGRTVAWKRLLEAIDVAELSFRNLRSLLAFGRGEMALAEAEVRERKERDSLKGKVPTTMMAHDEDDARGLEEAHDAQRPLGDSLGGYPERATPRRDRVPDKERAEVIDLARRMVSAYDRVLDGGKEEAGRAVRARCLNGRHTWAAYVSRWKGLGWRKGERSVSERKRLRAERAKEKWAKKGFQGMGEGESAREIVEGREEVKAIEEGESTRNGFEGGEDGERPREEVVV